MRIFVFLSSIFVFLGLVGCARQNLPADLPKLVPCRLTFTQDGRPLADARIVLESVEESKWFPGGTTDSSGTTVLLTNGRYKGAPAGQYKITVHKTETEPANVPPEPPTNSPDYHKWFNAYSGARGASFSLVEEKYGSLETTPLELTVSGRTVTETFDVGKSVRNPLKITVIRDGK